MSEASAHKLAYIVEPTRGTTPTNPRFQYLPDTRTTLALTKENLETERLTGNRFPAKPRTGASQVGGEIPADLSFEAYNEFISSALQGPFVAQHVGEDTVDITIDSVATPGIVVTDTYATTNGIVTFEYIDAANQIVRAKYDESGAISNYEWNGLETLTIDGETFEVTAYTNVQEDFIAVAGDTRKSFSIIREFSDFEGGEKPFLLYSGCEVATWSIEAAANNLAKSTFTWFGRDGLAPSETAPAGTSYKDAIDTEPFDTFNGEMKIDGVADCIVTDYSLTINNGHAPRFTVGCDSSQDPSVTQSIIEGSITVYFENAALLEKFYDETGLALELTLQDSNGNQLIIDLPNLHIGSGTQPDVTADGPITMPINFTAHEDPTLGSHISVRSLSAP